MTRRPQQQAESFASLLRYALAIHPDEFGLVLDSEGWAPIKSVVQALAEEPGHGGVRAATILALQWQLNPFPFELTETHVRFIPGFEPELSPPSREPQPPPPLLYYGCRRKPYAVYREEGIPALEGKEIVLARDPAMALRIGGRREPKPVKVEVQTPIAERMGVRFLAYGEQLFVVDRLPAECLFGPTPKVEVEAPRKPKKPKKPDSGGPSAPRPEDFVSIPWVPDSDRLIARDPEEARKILKRERGKKRVTWKDEQRGGKKPDREIEPDGDSDEA